ncbi:MAG: polyphenol oxidase family protein [Verrucomicrobiota bacterium]|nr:polyphenol oxidase family protein [Verrucomicrobiota bacterium]
MSAPAAGPDSVLEFFPALQEISFVRHAFLGRIPGIDVATERAAALERLDATHRTLRAELGLGEKFFATAEQVHGNKIAVIDSALVADRCYDGADGLITNQPGVSLGIYVADCGAVYLVDPVQRCLGLVHSGKKGTELAIVENAIHALQENFGSKPSNLIVQLGPCIRPPHYEIDFAAEIVRQARRAGAAQVHDCGLCTASDLAHYYSYRAEKARTGRMLALLALGD